MDATKTAEYAAGLRELADWFEEHGEQLSLGDVNQDARLPICRTTQDEFLDAARMLGPCERDEDRRYFTLTRRFGPVRIDLFIDPKHVGTSKTTMRPTTEWELNPEVRTLLADIGAAV